MPRSHIPVRTVAAVALATSALVLTLGLAPAAAQTGAAPEPPATTQAEGTDELSRTITRYGSLEEDRYTAASWSAFAPRFGDAETVASTSTDPAAREAARADLEAAVGELVDVAGLRDLIDDLAGRDPEDYAPTAWAAHTAALDAARATAADEAASASAVVDAKNAVQQSGDALVRVDGGEFLPIRNDGFWHDTDGNPIYSQGGGVFRFGDTYYWYGVRYQGAEEYYASPTKTYGYDFDAITVYSSRNLVEWTYEGDVATTDTALWIPPSKDLLADSFSRMQTLAEASWLGRLGVSYNENTGKYVLFIQFKNPYDDESADESAGVLMLQGDSPTDAFEYANLQTKIPGVAYYGTGDQTVFTDDDGTDYLIFSNRFGRANGYVARISDADSLSIDPAVNVWRQNGGREGNAMFRLDDRYYLAASDLHGWNTSVTHVVESDTIQGGYSPQYVLPGTEKDYSHVTQTGFFVTVEGTEQDTVIFAGDRWAGFAWNGLGFNQWMPLSKDGDDVRFESVSHWEFNAVTGEWRVGADNNYALNPEFAADRVSVKTLTGWANVVDADSTATSLVSNVKPGAPTTQWGLRLGAATAYSGGVAQEVDVPAGRYRVGISSAATGALEDARIVVTGSDGEAHTLELDTTATTWTPQSASDIVLPEGSATISILARGPGGSNLRADSVSLVREGDAVPSWQSEQEYDTGTRVAYDGAVWEATWWTRGQTPGDPHGPWQEVAEDDAGRVVWTPSRIFDAGETVVHDGAEFTAKWWTRNQRPGDPYGPWAPAG